MSTSSNSVNHAHPIVATIAYYLAFIILGLTTAAAGPSLLRLADHTASPLNIISYIFVLSSLGYLIGSFFGGRIYDRFSGHRFMAMTLVVMAIYMHLYSQSPTHWHFSCLPCSSTDWPPAFWM